MQVDNEVALNNDFQSSLNRKKCFVFSQNEQCRKKV